MANKRVLNNLLWKLGERGSVQFIQFFAQLLLARLLSPNDYGTLAIVLVFINLANIFIQSGLGTALIQKKEISKTDTSTVFFASCFIAIIGIIILWIVAPFISTFYGDPRISAYLRVSSFSLLVGAFNSIQIALISKKLEFKKNFISSLGGIIPATIISIYMALNGYGVWSLIANYVINIIVTSFILYVINPWLPSFTFSFKAFKSLFNFGYKLLIANLISAIFTDLYALLIGKRYSRTWLGFYENGNKIPAVASNALTTAAQSVLLPVLSEVQDDTRRLKSKMRKSIKVCALLIFPIMGILATCAKPLITILLTDKWIMAVPFLQLSAILYAFYPIHLINLQAINAIGRSDVFMHCEIKKKIVELAFLSITIWFNIYILAIGRVLTSIIALYINMNPNKKFISYGSREQLKDIIIPFLIALGSSILVYPINWWIYDPWVAVILQITIFIGLYLCATLIWNKETLRCLIKQVTL